MGCWVIETCFTLDEGYTPLAIDLMDTNNQRIFYGGNINYPNDQVENYTISQLENALLPSFGSWWSWRTVIKDMYANPTEVHVDYLFQTYY